MNRRTTFTLSALLAVAFSLTGAALASGGAPAHATVTIHHQTQGCHAWAVNGGAYKASQTVTIARGGSITVINNDVMPHKLVKLSGAAVTITRVSAGMQMGLKGTFAPAMLARMGASAKVVFAKAGTYRFTTKPGEDYMKGIMTKGEDNVLKLTVVVR